jgi:trans-2,3-dihydro-3-hydroxyanthranilate isomerase
MSSFKTKPYRIIYLDAFTAEPFSGNPCAVLPQADGLTDRQMQQIALETNLSETAFVFPSDKAAVKVRYFMPRREIPFAGHPTIATAVMLAQEGLIPGGQSKVAVDFEFNIGVLPVEIQLDPAGRPLKAIMTQQRPSFGARVAGAELARCLGLDKTNFVKNTPLQVVSTGVPFLMVPVTGLNVLKKVQIDRPVFESVLQRIGVDAAYLFCLEGFEPDADAHGRLFPAAVGSEDPFTGSAAGCMGAYLAHHGLCAGQVLRVEQGHLMGRPGKGTVEIVGSAGNIEAVKVGGSAVRTLEGMIFIQNRSPG